MANDYTQVSESKKPTQTVSVQANRAPQFVRAPGVIAGVAQGLANDFSVDVVLVRILWLVSFCLGVGFLAYVMCWIAFPHWADPTVGRRKRLLGVCWKVAERAKQPVGLIRLAAMMLLLASAGAAIVGYILALLILPDESSPSQYSSNSSI